MVKEQGIKLIAILEPQSPMIHFQARETGAVLRASEVKPKLDRFLIRKMIGSNQRGEQSSEEDALKNLKKNLSGYFRDPENSDALNYKMSIIATSVKEFSLEDDKRRSKYDPFFANSGKEDDEKLRGILVTAKLTITCFNKGLRGEIKKNLEEFFVVTNFGMMQGKGFGSFIVSNSVRTRVVDKGKKLTNTDEIGRLAQLLMREVASDRCYYMEFNAVDDNEESRINGIYKKMFKEIKLFYGIMKSGYNINGEYARSYIYEYMHDNYSLGNEKKWMKEEKIAPAIMNPEEISELQLNLDGAIKVFWNKNRNNGKINIGMLSKNNNRPTYIPDPTWNAGSDNDSTYYVRALLGTAIQNEFKTGYKKGNNSRWNLAGGTRDKVSVEITEKSGDLERVPSPIYFKIIKNVVFIVAKKIPEEIYGKEFEFSSDWGRGTISTPSKEKLTNDKNGAFDIQRFLESYVNYYNDASDSGLRDKVSKVNDARIVKRIPRNQEETNE